MRLNTDHLKTLIKIAFNSREDEIGCDDCFDKLHSFAELKLAGKSAEEAMPLVEDHLNRCGECKEEFEVLLEALKSEQASN